MNLRLKQITYLVLAAALTTSLSVSAAIPVDFTDFFAPPGTTMTLLIDADKDTVDAIRTKFAEKFGVPSASVLLYQIRRTTNKTYDPRYFIGLNYSKLLRDNYDSNQQYEYDVKDGMSLCFYIIKTKDGALDISDLECTIKSDHIKGRLANSVIAYLQAQVKDAAAKSAGTSSDAGDKKDGSKKAGDNGDEKDSTTTT